MLLFVFTFVLVLSEVDVEVEVEVEVDVVLTSEVVLTVETVVVWANACVAPTANSSARSNFFILTPEFIVYITKHFKFSE
jgi:hypothetical protein